MRVFLISPNREQLPDPVFPLGLSYVAGALIGAGHDVSAVDLLNAESIEEAIRLSVSEFGPDAIGISLRNVDDVSYPKMHSYLAEYKEVMRAVRKHSSAPVILGGSGFTIMPGEFMRELGADFGIMGEAERSFPALLSRLGSAEKVVSPSMVGDLDAVRPERGLFDSGKYYEQGGALNIQTKRGCGFNCVYCTYPMVEGRAMRLRSPSAVAAEMESVIAETGARHFFIVDSVFNNPPSHAEAVCREIISRGIEAKWSCYASPLGMTPELIELMQRAGCTGVEFGTDSLDDDIMRNLGKAFDFRRVGEVSDACRKAGLKFCHFIFLGAPGEDAETARRNIGRMDSINPDAAVIMAGIRIFPGTRLHEIAKEELGISDAGLEPMFYISPSMLHSISGLADEIGKRRNWAMPGFEINIHERLQRKLRGMGMKGSLWEGLAQRR